MLLNVSPAYLYYNDSIQRVNDIHKPYFLAFLPSDMKADKAFDKLKQEMTDDDRVVGFGDIQRYDSFWNPNIQRDAIKVFTRHPGLVPETSDKVFNLGFYTAEHDIPYHERVLTDLAASDQWIFDTQGRHEKLKALIYDIELTKYTEMKHAPIDIIGYSEVALTYSGSKNLENEEFLFDISDIPEPSEDVHQLISEDEDQEIKNLIAFSEKVMNADIISGHNILGFDNMKVCERISHFMQKISVLSKNEIQPLKKFTERYTRDDHVFYFGVANNVTLFYPSSFDTYHAARKFYNLNQYSLEGVVSFLNLGVENRLHLAPEEMKLDDRTLLYNRQDIIEEVRVFLSLVQQGLPLAFTTGMPFDMLFSSGAVKMWDFMAIIRAAYHKKIMPALCKTYEIAKKIDTYGKTKREIVTETRRQNGTSKELMRVIKYGEEMPDWVEYPFLIYDKEHKSIAYHFPGGMTIKPDSEAYSDYIPWYDVTIADVGAMYPTILRAINAGADTVRLTTEGTPDDWVWLKKIPERLLVDIKPVCRDGEEEFIDKGLLIGVNIDEKPGVVNLAMKGLMGFINNIKKEMNEKEGRERRILKMMYQSLKAARNAGTHGILSAPMVSCRQFNLWGAALITTMGQQILYDTLKTLESNNARVVYGDTDGIYVGCSRSASHAFRAVLQAPPGESTWIVEPYEVEKIIEYCNDKWRRKLKYDDFELEIEKHDGMIFVKHKNYLIFDAKDNAVQMTTKGNNFKGSDKPNIARIVLDDIMKVVLMDNLEWTDENEARERVKESIMKITLDKVKDLDIETFGMDAFSLVQSVQPSRSYKPNPNGSMSVYGQRAAALEQLLGRIGARRKFQFVITKKPLPGVKNPTKSGIKPIHYMYPIELIKNREEIDMEWYKDMIKNFIQGAFGLSAIEDSKQCGLDQWM